MKIVGRRAPWASTRASSQQASAPSAWLGFADDFNPPWDGLAMSKNAPGPQAAQPWYLTSYSGGVAAVDPEVEIPITEYLQQGSGLWKVNETFDSLHPPGFVTPGAWAGLLKKSPWRLAGQPTDFAHYAQLQGHAVLGVNAIDGDYLALALNDSTRVGLYLNYSSPTGTQFGSIFIEPFAGVGVEYAYNGPFTAGLSTSGGWLTISSAPGTPGFDAPIGPHQPATLTRSIALVPPFYFHIYADVEVNTAHVKVTSDRAGEHVIEDLDFPGLSFYDTWAELRRTGPLPVFPAFQADGDMLADDQVGLLVSNTMTGDITVPLRPSKVEIDYYAWTYAGPTVPVPIVSTIKAGAPKRASVQKHSRKHSGHAKSGISVSSPMSS